MYNKKEQTYPGTPEVVQGVMSLKYFLFFTVWSKSVTHASLQF